MKAVLWVLLALLVASLAMWMQAERGMSRWDYRVVCERYWVIAWNEGRGEPEMVRVCK